MEVNSSRGAIQIKHKKQSSHDSGTFLDWDETVSHTNNVSRSEPLDNTPIQFNSNVTGEFVTVVAVEAKDTADQVDSPNNNFVTVLTVNSAIDRTNTFENGKDMGVDNRKNTDTYRNVESMAHKVDNNENGFPNQGIIRDGKDRSYLNVNKDTNRVTNGEREVSWNVNQNETQFIESEILVYRLPGERLGFGLKFEGGLQTNQKVSRLFVQSCATESPASRTRTPWGHFTPGDEIVRINNIEIHELSRIDCVKFLKESTVVLKLFVRHLKSSSDVLDENFDEKPVNQMGTAEDGFSFPKNEIGRNPEMLREITVSDSKMPSSKESMTVKCDNSPPPIPPRKLLKKVSNASAIEKRLTSPKASPRSLLNSEDKEQLVDRANINSLDNNKNKTQNQNKIVVHDGKIKLEEFYEIDLKLSDEDIDEIIENLDKTENEEAMKTTVNGIGKVHEAENAKQANLDINDNVQSNGVPSQTYHQGHGYYSGVRNDSLVTEAEFYTNLFLDSNDTLFESESDDTGSSHTTAIDRLSLHSSDRISLTSSSSFSDIKSLNSFELDIDSNIDTIIDFDKVLEPLEGSVETLPIEKAVQNAGTEALYGPFVKKNVVHEEQILSKQFDQTETNLIEISNTNRSPNIQDVSKLKSQSDPKLSSPKPLPRSNVQKMKFKSGKKMPPPPPPPVQNVEVLDKSINVENIKVREKRFRIEEKSSEKISTVKTTKIATEDKITSCETFQDSQEKILNKTNSTEKSAVGSEKSDKENTDMNENSKKSRTIDVGETIINEPTKPANESRDNNLYTTVEQISIVDNPLPKVIKAQEKVPTDSSLIFKSTNDLSVLETIVENDEHHHHLPRLIDFVPKDKIKSMSPEKSKKLNAIIYEQQKVVEYFTTPHTTTNGKNGSRTNKQQSERIESVKTSANANGKHITSSSQTAKNISPTQKIQTTHANNHKASVENKETLETKSLKTEIPEGLSKENQNGPSNTERCIDETSESLNTNGLQDDCAKKEEFILEDIDRRADGGEQEPTVAENDRDDTNVDEHVDDHSNREHTVPSLAELVDVSRDLKKDDTSSVSPAALSSSNLPQPGLKLCDGIADQTTGSHEFAPPNSSPSDAMMPSPVVLPLPHSTRLPPDGHEFPQSYQELHSPSALPGDFLSYSAKPNCPSNTPAKPKTQILSKVNHPEKSQTMVPTNGLPPTLPTSNPPVTRKLSRPSSESRDPYSRDFSSVRREVSPRKELTSPMRDSISGSNACDNKTESQSRFGKVAETLPNYKYGNKDEKSERSVRDKIAMFSNKSTTGAAVSFNSSPTSFTGQNNAHKFVEPLKRPLAREASPFGLAVIPKDANSAKEHFKNDEIVSHSYLTNLEVDNSYLQNHYQESVNCQSESSAYSSLSTSEILYDKNGDFSGLNNGYSMKNGYDTSDYVNSNYIKSAVSGQEKRESESKISDFNISNATTLDVNKTTNSSDIYKQKYTQDLSTSRQSDKMTTNYDSCKSNFLDTTYNKYNSESKTNINPKGYYTISGKKTSAKPPEYKVNDFSSLPRKLKVLKSLDQESRESSPESGSYTSKLTRTISFNNPPLLHMRSQSMIDINRNNAADSISKLIEKRKKNISKLKGLIIPEKSEIPASSIAICNLPEIKVKSNAFLTSEPNQRSIMKQPIPLERTVSNPLDQKQTNSYERKRNNSVDNTIDQVNIGRCLEKEKVCMTSSTWDLNDIPKYSPAFKRKSLTVYDKTKQFSTPTDLNSAKKVSPPKPPRKSCEGKINNEQIDAIISFDRIKENCKTKKIGTTKLSFSESKDTFEKPVENKDKVGEIPTDCPRSVNNAYMMPEEKHSKSDWKSKDSTNCLFEKQEKGNERLKATDRLGVKNLNILTAYETESSGSDDNDSAISSNVSPPLSPLKRDETDGRNQQRKISTNSSSSSTLTSGDDSMQYQAGDGTPKRILKPQSVEAVNRKNVLSSAKFRSGDKTNEPIVKENEPIHEDLARCVDNRLKSVKGLGIFQNDLPRNKLDDDEYSSSTLNDNEEEDFEFNDECTDKIYSRRLSNIKVAYLDVQVDSAESSDDILSSSDLISEGANSDDEMSVTSSECRNGGTTLSTVGDDWGNTPDEICSKIEEYIDDLEMYSQEIEEKRSKLISERTRRVRRTQESVKIDKFVRTNEFLRNAKLSEANEKLANSPEHKPPKEKELSRAPSRTRLERIKKEINEPETTETEASFDEKMKKPAKPSNKPSLPTKSIKADVKPGRETSKIDEIKSVYLRSVSNCETSTGIESSTPISRKFSGVSVVRKLADYSKSNGATLPDHTKSGNAILPDYAKTNASTMLPTRLPPSHHMRVSSLDSTTSDDSFTMQREQFGSITSIASSTSLISQQELQQLIEESNQCLDDSSVTSLIPGTAEVSVVVLHRDLPGNSVGITLAGGSDYESKEITVHKVISGTPADRDGRLQKGDRILSINGKSMKGLTHKESLAILKAPRSEVVLVVSRWKPNTEGDSSLSSSPNISTLSASNLSNVSTSNLSNLSTSNHSTMSPQLSSSTNTYLLATSPSSATVSNAFSTSINSQSIGPSSSLTGSNTLTSSSSSMTSSSSPMRTVGARAGLASVSDSPSTQSDTSVPRGPPVDVTLIKDGAGLGFSLEGGKDSPLGDLPLTIKKIFTGGCAEKNGQLRAGDEILAINGSAVSELTRIDAWSLLKKLNDGSVLLTLRHKI